MLKIFRLAIFTAIFLLGALSVAAQPNRAHIDVLNVKGTINPVLVGYIQRGIEEAENDGAVACVIEMDTPGGLDSAMRDIVQSILNARLPVVIYVSPSGARAASAGVFITLSAHVAAMASNTVIGAAHPVALGEGISDEEMEKIVNDAAAYIRSLAASRGRNADWAERAVRESVSLTEVEALQQNVVDIVAPTLDDLLPQLNGRSITLIDGTTVTLNTLNAAVNPINMNWVEDFLYTISDPNIAYLLLSLGSLGILVEIFNPGLIFPGVVGAISLFLALYALGMLPVNWTGVLLIILAFGLFVAEAFTPGFGLLFGGGMVALVLGSLILFQGRSPLFQVDWWVITLVAASIGGIMLFIIFKVVKAHRTKATTGREELQGETALVKKALDPEGTVFLKGELWKTISESGEINSGEEVVITRVEGLKLFVKKTPPQNSSS